MNYSDLRGLALAIAATGVLAGCDRTTPKSTIADEAATSAAASAAAAEKAAIAAQKEASRRSEAERVVMPHGAIAPTTHDGGPNIGSPVIALPHNAMAMHNNVATQAEREAAPRLRP